ncbi:MAG: aldo/keto reductase [Planctomycetota bacterium]
MSVILGLWPIAGITTLNVTEREAEQTLHAAIDAGITQFDTAFSYGYDGESDRLLGRVLTARSLDAKVIGKVGQRWQGTTRVVDGQPTTLIVDAECSLSRLRKSTFDCLMLHSPDPEVPIERSAEALAKLQQRGLCETIGVCNVDAEQLTRFAGVVRCEMIQCPLNLIQRDALDELIPVAKKLGAGSMTFWALMKGLLAGKLKPESEMDPADPRQRYEIFRGQYRQRADRVVDNLRELGQSTNQTVAQLAIGWTLAQPGVSGVLAGARRPGQVTEWAGCRAIDAALIEKIDRIVSNAFEGFDY